MTRPLYVEATREPFGCWRLPNNPLWNIPKDTACVLFQYGTRPEFGFSSVFGLRSIKGLVVARIYNHDDFTSMPDRLLVFGMRTLGRIGDSGYQLRGRVSISGTKYNAITSSQLLEREDGTTCNVAVLSLCGWAP